MFVRPKAAGFEREGFEQGENTYPLNPKGADDVKKVIILGGTGCSFYIVFFPKILKYSGLWHFCFPLVSVCVHTPGR